jgi:hypothetical protein
MWMYTTQTCVEGREVESVNKFKVAVTLVDV